MHATAKTPKKTRSELMQHVHQPELIRVDYPSEDHQPYRSPLLAALAQSCIEYDIMQDPYTKELLQKQRDGADVSKQLQKLFMSQKTYCSEQLKTLNNKARDMLQELGSSAVDWYLHQCMARFGTTIRNAEQLLDWSSDEKQHLLSILRKLPLADTENATCSSLSTDHISHKVESLIDVLVKEAMNNPSFTGLVFVEQRAWVAVLAEILAVHPRTRHLFRVGTFLGTSQSSKRKAMIAAFAEPRNQQTTLEDFRAGTINLILATSVLEEGIDVSNCHLVICFEPPKNLKSFVQRRGRARMQKSKYFVFVPNTGSARHPESWEVLEEEMKRAYLADVRRAKVAEERELEEEDGARCFEVKSTGARLTLDDALPHLNHFCANLGSGPYVDPRPQFTIRSNAFSTCSAEVTLPIAVDPAVRTAKSLMSWRTEKMAKKDAAFEAYKALHLAGLVNDHLLPVRSEADGKASEAQIPQHTPSMVPSLPTLNPWLSVAERHYLKHRTYFRTLVQIQAAGEQRLYFRLFTLLDVPPVGEIELYWNESKTYIATMSRQSQVTLDPGEIKALQSITRKILVSIHSGHMQDVRHDFIWLIAPCDSNGKALSLAKLETWDSGTNGCQPFLSLSAKAMNKQSQWGLISEYGDNRKYFLQAITNQQLNTSNTSTTEANLQVVQVPKRRDFLHRLSKRGGMNDAYTRTEDLMASQCQMDSLPAYWVKVALLLPSIMHRAESAMIADILRKTLLGPVDIQAEDLPLLVQALTASSAYGENNYQRLEFIGDGILKLIACLHVMAENPTWPEGYLSGKKGALVSNGFLARATLTAELDKFIITESFTGAKWSPRYWMNMLADATLPTRKDRSSKLLADVVESLIGMGYTVGGLPKAFACVQALLPLEKWTPISEANGILYNAAPTNLAVTNLGVLEELIGYTFTKKMLLLEAVTHASYTGPNAHCSYERLEFLGDAVLDYILSSRLYGSEPSVPLQKMHAMRTAMANAAFLAYSMLETKVSEETINKSTLQPAVHHRALWQFLRAGSSQLLATRDVALRQHEKVREQLSHALTHGDEFPWHLLALVNAPKVLSDIVESVIGAIYIDSRGDFSACEVFVHRLGILDTLERIIRDDVDCLHPKERLGHLAVERDVKYVRVLRNASNELGLPPGSSPAYKCQVMVGGEVVGGVVEGLTRQNAETVAAWRVNKYLMHAKEVVLGSDGEEEVFFDAEERGGIVMGDW